MEQSIPVCPACNSTENRVKFARFSRRFMECGRCGVIFMYPFHEQGETEGAYDRTYYKSWGMDQGDNQLVRRMKMKTAHRLLKTVEKFMPPGRLLDVGCAAGHFLEAAQGKGWDVYGVELSSYAAQLAKEKFGDHIYAGPYETVPFTNDFFDCIIPTTIYNEVCH